MIQHCHSMLGCGYPIWLLWEENLNCSCSLGAKLLAVVWSREVAASQRLDYNYIVVD